jgi:DNA-binding MurR/RpiR family transcriptional regulator
MASFSSDGGPLSRRILDHYETFPRGERRLADLLLKQNGNLSSYSASELAAEAGVSNATAARFFQRLGYLSFRQAREQNRRPDPAQAPVTADLSRIGADIALHLSSDTQNLRYTFDAMRPDDLRSAIGALAIAEKIWVVGFDDDYALAHFARSLLIRIKPDIRMLPLGGFSVPEEFASISPRDAILGFGIKRRAPALMQIVRSGCDAGAQVILVSDDAAAKPDLPLVSLRCRTRGAFLFDSVSAPISLMTYVCSAVASIIGEEAVERLHRIESIHDGWGDNSPADD